MAGRFAAAELAGETLAPPPVETALGALLGHITGGAAAETYQPMNVNFGLFPPIPGRSKKADRKRMYTSRAKEALEGWLSSLSRSDGEGDHPKGGGGVAAVGSEDLAGTA
jgi:methylenetetrahydrofolate--tRNA-(uracil-5-)-methyltransferase